MEAKAIELIQQTAILANAKALDTFTPVIALPAGTTVQSLEKFQAGRSRFRGSLSTESLTSFTDYVLARQEVAAEGFVDAEAMNCLVYFNLGDEDRPGHGDYTASLTLKKTSAFKALERAAGSTWSQKDLSDWLEDWLPNINAQDAEGVDIPLSKAIAAIRSITVESLRKGEHNVSDMSASRSTLEQVEARSDQGLPAELMFSCPPYEGLKSRSVRLRVGVLTSSDKPAIRLRWIGEEALREEIAEEFKDLLKTEVGGAANLTVGTFKL